MLKPNFHNVNNLKAINNCFKSLSSSILVDTLEHETLVN